MAFLGRSNVGKSSLLNALLGRREIARVSGTPGKTQLMNVYRLPSAYILDLPGYGYARTSQAERRRFRALLTGVLTQRPTLAGVVWLLDIRHPPSKDDLEFRNLLAQSGRPALTVLTKLDKLTHSGQKRAIIERLAELGLTEDEVIPTSVTTRAGIGELGAAIREVVTSHSAA